MTATYALALTALIWPLGVAAETSPDKPVVSPERKIYQMKKDVIETNLPEADKLRELAAAIGDIETQVEQLSSDVQKTKQKLIEDARINNNARIEIHLEEGSDHASIRQLAVKLDGYKVYAIDDSSGLWLPTNALPIYSGPLQPGDHKIDVEAILTLKDKDHLPLHTRQNRSIKQTLTVNMPEGQQINKTWHVVLRPAKSGEAATAILNSNEAM